uniref:Uncharacterized protein n=1 Tax=Angiostrongylus cantonensis TaxID=6313 RepID=A0A0K0DFF3_ANGCA
MRRVRPPNDEAFAVDDLGAERRRNTLNRRLHSRTQQYLSTDYAQCSFATSITKSEKQHAVCTAPVPFRSRQR